MNAATYNAAPEEHTAHEFVRRCMSPVPWAAIWLVDCSVKPQPAVDEALCEEELARADTYRFEADRRSFILRRAALRGLIAERLHCHPRSVRFSNDKYGR